MDEVRIWRISENAVNGPRAEPLAEVDEAKTEQLLEDVLARSPEVLLEGLTLIGRQNETGSGPLDLLGVDDDGRLVVFELKKGQLRREAVAQVIDYASRLAAMDPEALNQHISQLSGRRGIEKIENFTEWYQENYSASLVDIGRPRMVLVGLGVDEAAKRMVEFLAGADLDISLITFYGFCENGQTLLARQVEVTARHPEQTLKTSKQTNLARLDERVKECGIEVLYRDLVGSIEESFEASVYLWPNAGGYTFYLQDVTEAGRPSNRAYVSLYVPDSYKTTPRLQVLLQSRTVEAVGREALEGIASLLHSTLVVKASGWAEIWLDPRRPSADYQAGLRQLAQAVEAAWKARRRAAEAKVEA